MSLLSDTLQQLGGAAGKRLKVFSYQERFASLWQMVARPLEAGTLCTMVIVWDGIPKGQTGAVNTSRYLTPIDWAVALGLQCRDAFPSFRVLVFDLGSHLVRDADSLRLLPLLAQALPWFSIYRVDKAPEFVDAFLESGRPSTAEKNTVEHLDLLRQIWAANLSRTSNTDDHHALFNLLGPQLLLKESNRAVDPTVSALRTLMGSVGLLPQEGQEDKGLLGGPWIDKKDMGLTRLRLILVDDQWRDGWGEVLCKAVGADYGCSDTGQADLLPIGVSKEGNISVFATSSPKWLLEKLEGNCDDQRFRFRLDEENPEEGGNADWVEILFLDLRLFSGLGVGQVEANHIKKLVAIARRIMASGRTLPWPGFLDEDLTDIESWIKEIRTDKGEKGKDARNDPRYHKALTLLPRILALVDLSLPIIIFSSTGRREIVKEFEAYGNIITVFEKPRLQGQEQQDIAAQAGAQFRAAFQEAMEFVEGRRICRILLTTPLPEIQTECKDLPSSPEQPWTIELYTDETGSEFEQGTGLPVENKPLTFGGLLAVFPPGNDPDSFNRVLLQYLSNQGIASKSELRDLAEGVLGNIPSLKSKSLPCHIGRFALTGDIPAEDEDNRDGDLERFHVADNLYQDLARNGVEIALYHLARRLLPASAAVSSRIYMATRHFPIPEYTDYCRRLYQRFGIETVRLGSDAVLWEITQKLKGLSKEFQQQIEKEQGLRQKPEQGIRYLGFDAVRFVARDIASHYRLASFRPRGEHARAYLLPKEELFLDTQANRANALHQLADAILNPTCRGVAINKIYAGGFEDRFDHCLQVLIHGARLASCGQKAEALAGSAEIAAELCQSTKMADRNAAAILIASLCEAAETLTGREFRFFLSRRKEQKGLDDTPSIQGTVFRCSKNKDIIRSDSGALYVVDSTMADRPVLGIGDTVRFLGKKDFVTGDRIVTKILDVTAHVLWNTIRKNQEFTGTVLHEDGIIDLGGITGRLIAADADGLQKGQTIRVYVYSCKKEKRAVFLRRSEEIDRKPDRASLAVGSIHIGTVTGIEIYGAFVVLENGARGLLHISQIVNAFVASVEAYCRKDDKVEVQVLSIETSKPAFGLVRNLTLDQAGKYAEFRTTQ